mmetsp:Transcript_59021/g.175494  ORF Transcript_59021/g.175494 Transcript_59021/m.175494 type:complete len:172 (-) Transcript_59021:64-579(-)
MVHSLSWSPSGRILAAGLGDGTCSLLRVEGRKLTDVARLREGHRATVASVLFPKFGLGSSSHVAAEDRLFVSAGNDGAILLWDLGCDIAGENAENPKSMLRCNRKDPKSESTEGIMASLALDSQPKVLFGISHGEKPNWLVNSSASEPVLPASLFIADTSSAITAYTIPCR